MLGDGGDVALTVPASSSAQTVQELVEQMRRDPNNANYVSSGIGFPSHIVSELFKREAKFDAVHLPAKGAGNAMLEFLSGRMSFYFPPVSLAVPQLKGGKIRVLAVAAAKRNPLLPDVPTLAERGYPGVSPVPYWITIFAPAGTPRAIVDTLGTEIRRITKTPEYRPVLQAQGLVPSDLTPDELGERVKHDLAYWMKTAKPLGIKVD
jgi:tripartite-type tricarboxylate transporter receptor subunit TctC